MEEKMTSIFDMIVKIDCLTQNLYYSSAVHDVNEARIRHLEYKSIGMEARMLENNLLFTGLQEMSDENFVSVASNSLKNTMNQVDNPIIEGASESAT
jgi:hypothetical protein